MRGQTKLIINTSIIVVSVMLIVPLFLTSCSVSKQEIQTTTQMDASTVIEDRMSTKSEDPTIASKEFEVDQPSETKETSLEGLEEQIERELQTQEGTWSVYVKDLKNNNLAQISSQRQKAASLIKLFIMAALFDRMESGVLERTAEIDGLLWDMITVSHNEATNQLVTILGDGDIATGMTHVNDYCQRNGYTDTEQQRDLKDWRPEPIPQENYTSVNDCGLLLERIYTGSCVSKQADQEMLELLFAQTRTAKIPAGLPSGTKVANKTGELTDTENDVAIVFASNTDYVICVISNDLSDTSAAQTRIVSISQLVYEYFENL
jgi:beta-lactamase class A